MSITRLLTTPCALLATRVQRDEDEQPITDRLGNEVVATERVETYNNGDPLLCRYEPARRREHDEAGEISEDAGRVWLRPDIDVAHVDAIDVEGVGVLTVVGEPGRWTGPRHSRNDHIELTVERTEGSEEPADEES